MTRALLAAAALALPLAAATAPPSASAGQEVSVGPFRFPRAMERDGARFVLEGAGLFRWARVVKVYAAAHFVGEGAAGAPLDADAPRRLEIAYHVSIDAEDFGKAADALLAESHPPEAIAALRPRLDRLHESYYDVKEGDRYALTYLPGRGTELALNGRRLVVIEGADFARAYFGIWLGARPIDEGLRDRLLGARGQPPLRTATTALGMGQARTLSAAEGIPSNPPTRSTSLPPPRT